MAQRVQTHATTNLRGAGLITAKDPDDGDPRPAMPDQRAGHLRAGHDSKATSNRLAPPLPPFPSFPAPRPLADSRARIASVAPSTCRLHKTAHPALYAEPSIRFAETNCQRQLGLANPRSASSSHSASCPSNPWRECAASEEWLAQRPISRQQKSSLPAAPSTSRPRRWQARRTLLEQKPIDSISVARQPIKNALRRRSPARLRYTVSIHRHSLP